MLWLYFLFYKSNVTTPGPWWEEWSLCQGEMGSLIVYQLCLKSLHILFCFKFGSQQLVVLHRFYFWGGGVLNCLFLESSVLLFQADMFVLQAWGIVLILDFPSLPSRIGSTTPSCPLGVDPASFLNSSLAFLEYIIIKLPEKDYARDKLSDSMNSQKYLYLAIWLNFLTGKVKPLEHLNRGNFMEKNWLHK